MGGCGTRVSRHAAALAQPAARRCPAADAFAEAAENHRKTCRLRHSIRPPTRGRGVIARGDIYWARFAPRPGSEQRGVRPAIVISNDGFNGNPRWNSILAIPCTTSTLQGARPATVVPLSKSLTGLTDDGYAI